MPLKSTAVNNSMPAEDGTCLHCIHELEDNIYIIITSSLFNDVIQT